MTYLTGASSHSTDAKPWRLKYSLGGIFSSGAYTSPGAPSARPNARAGRATSYSSPPGRPHASWDGAPGYRRHRNCRAPASAPPDDNKHASACYWRRTAHLPAGVASQHLREILGELPILLGRSTVAHNTGHASSVPSPRWALGRRRGSLAL